MTTAGRPRPHRDDVPIAASGPAGGLVMWAFGFSTDSGNHPVGDHPRLPLVPLAIMAGCELLRRAAPRYAIAAGTLTFCADFVIGSLLVTVLMFTDLVCAAVPYGPKRLTRVVPVVGVIVRRHRDEAGAESLRAEQTALLAELDRREAVGREALAVIRENSVQGLSEMRRLIGLLRDSAGEDAPRFPRRWSRRPTASCRSPWPTPSSTRPRARCRYC